MIPDELRTYEPYVFKLINKDKIIEVTTPIVPIHGPAPTFQTR